jgi:hypothetical protein
MGCNGRVWDTYRVLLFVLEGMACRVTHILNLLPPFMGHRSLVGLIEISPKFIISAAAPVALSDMGQHDWQCPPTHQPPSLKPSFHHDPIQKIGLFLVQTKV